MSSRDVRIVCPRPYGTAVSPVLTVSFGRTSQVKPHSKWVLHFFIHVGYQKTVDEARHVVLSYVFNYNKHTSALAYSVFVSVIRTHGKQFSAFKSHFCPIKFSSKNWIHTHIGTQITGGNRNPSLPNFHWCQWFAISTVHSHGSQV